MKDNEEPNSNNLASLTASKQEIPSKFTPQYLQFHGLSLGNFNELKKETLQEVQKIVIIDHQRDCRSEVLVKMVSYSKGCEFIHLQVTLGSFIFPRIDVLNQNTESLTHSLFYRREGSFGKVFRAYCFQQEIAIKCFSYTKQTFSRVLSDALSQYCFLKLAAFLKVGPKLPSKTGYELIIYKDCIEFAMEYCEQIYYYTEIGQKEERQLKDSLLKIHQINQIHLDIKHDNIRYSTSYQRYVFIDFGFSKFIKEDLGFKTKTSFKGTLGYCSEEMKQLYEFSHEDYADMYYNDVNCLAVVLSKDQNKKIPPANFQIQKQARRVSFSEIEDITVHHLKYSIKYFICQEEHSTAKNVFKDYQRIFQRRNQSGNYKKVPIFTFDDILEQIADQAGQESDTCLIQPIINCISCINQLSSSGRIDVWNEDKTYEMKVIMDEQGQVKKEQESYYHILSRVLKVNSTKYTYQERDSLAKIAANALGISATVLYQGKQWKSCPEISYLSKLLFQFSLEFSQQSRSQIFINVVYNIFALQILNFDEIVHCFQQITTIQYNQSKMIEMMAAFYKGFCLLFYLTDRFDSFQRCRVEIQRIAMKFIQKLPKGIFKQVLHIIFSSELAEKKPEIPSNTLQRCKEKLFYEELQGFASHRLALAQYFKIFSQQQKYEKKVVQLLKQSIQKSFKHTSFQFQHYHFLWIIKCFEQDKYEECLKLSKIFYNIFQDKCIRFISLQLIDLTFALLKTPTMTILTFSQHLGQIKNKKYNNINEDIIKLLIHKIITTKSFIFRQIEEKYQKNIWEYLSIIKPNIYKESIDKSIWQLYIAVIIAIKLKNIYLKVFRYQNATNQLRQTAQFVYITLRKYYCQLRQLVLAQKNSSLAFFILVMASFHILKQNVATASKICKAICPVFARIKDLKYMHYQHFFIVALKMFTQDVEGIQQIFINYVDLVESNKQFDYLFKRKRTFGLIISCFYDNSSKKLPVFINTMARYLSICNQKRYVESYIEVFMVHLTLKSVTSKEQYEHLKSTSLGMIDRIEPISENPYNSLFFYHMISLNFLKANKNIFVQIFKAFRFMKANAQKYICRAIYEKYFDMFHKGIPKRKAKKILYLVIINQPNLIKFQLFMRLFKQNQQKVTNAQHESLHKHLKRLYDYQQPRLHFYQSQQLKIFKARKKNLIASVNSFIMRHLKTLDFNY